MAARVGIVGVGRKPGPFSKQKAIRVRGLQPMTPDESLLAPPGDLTEREAAIWSKQAPHAIQQVTLTQDTSGAFVQLCRLWATCDEMYERIQAIGLASDQAPRLVDAWLKVVHRVDQAQARFRLTAFGKPQLERKTGPAADNPFAAFSAHGQASRSA